MVVFVATITWRWIERQLVICLGVGQACVQERGDIVTGVEGETTGLSGYNLQAEVAKCSLARLADAFEEALIVEIAAYAFAGTQRIDAASPGRPKG
jgi:hypothetical protein